MVLDFSQNNIFAVFETTETGMVALKHFSSLPNSESEKKEYVISDVHICGEKHDTRFGAKHIGESGTVSLIYQKHNY